MIKTMKENHSEIFYTDIMLFLKNVLLILLIVDLAILYKSGFQMGSFVKLVGVSVFIIALFYVFYTKESVLFKTDMIVFSKKSIFKKTVLEYPLDEISYSYRKEVLSRGGGVPVISFYYKGKVVFKVIEGRDWRSSSVSDILTILKKHGKGQSHGIT